MTIKLNRDNEQYIVDITYSVNEFTYSYNKLLDIAKCYIGENYNYLFDVEPMDNDFKTVTVSFYFDAK